MNSETRKNTTEKILLPLLRSILWLSALFSMIITILLLATFIQTKIHDPINSPALDNLMQRLAMEPENQTLREDIRTLDLLARKAYFTSQWQVHWAGIFLITSCLIFFLCWQLLVLLKPSLPSPPSETFPKWQNQHPLLGKAFFFTGVILVSLALVSGFVVQPEFTLNPLVNKPKTAPPSAEELLKNWPGFRGPEGNGKAYYTQVPTSWDGITGTGIKWKVKVPIPGNSSPVIWKNQIFLTGGNQKVREVFCFALEDGSLQWRHQVQVSLSQQSSSVLKVDRETGYAAPTPACDGRYVYAIFPTGEFACLTLQGQQVWSRHFGIPENHYGHSSSLITADGYVYIQYDQYDRGRLYAFDGATGKEIWQAKRTILSWSSPICVNIGDHQELILTDNESVTAYDPGKGTLLWTFPCLYGEVGPSAAYADGMVFAAQEYAAAVGIKVSGLPSGKKPEIVWEWKEELPNTASPVATDKYLILATAHGVVTCLDAKKGSSFWNQEYPEGFYSSPIISGQRVYLLDRKGTMYIVSLSPNYNLENKALLGEPTVTTPAFLDGQILIRGNNHLFCITGGQSE